MAAYPTDIPVAEICEVIRIVRLNQVKEKTATFARNVWWIQGFIQKTIFGDDSSDSQTPDFSLAHGSSAKPDDFDAIAELEKLVTSAQSGAATTQISIPWQLILKWAIRELIKLLEDNLDA